MKQFTFIQFFKDKIDIWRDKLIIAHKAILIIGFVLLFLQLLYIPFFIYRPISHIKIEGLREVEETNIRANLGVLSRTRWASVDSFYLAQKIASLDWVKNTVVQRCMPLCLRVVVQEEKPVAFLKTPDKFLLITNEYKVHAVSGDYSWDLPVIHLKRKDLTDIEYHFAISRALYLIHELKTNYIDLSNLVSEIVIDNPVNLHMILSYQGLPIYMGFSKYTEKLNKLMTVLPIIQKQKRTYSYLDLRHPFGVVVNKKM